MSEHDRAHWNARYSSADHGGAEPDGFVLEALRHIEAERTPGTAIDLACGSGRHALELARRGWRTHAWDVSERALERCSQSARAAGLELALRRVDLEDAHAPPPGAGPFDLALIVNFLDRGLLQSLARWTPPGGWLIYASFAPEWPGEKPAPRFRIARSELTGLLRGFTPVRWGGEPGRCALLAQRSA